MKYKWTVNIQRIGAKIQYTAILLKYSCRAKYSFCLKNKIFGNCIPFVFYQTSFNKGNEFKWEMEYYF